MSQLLKMLRLVWLVAALVTAWANLIGKVISPAIKPSDKSVETLLQNGVPVRLDQASNSNVVKNVAAAMDNLPFTAGVRQAQKTAQNEGLNRAVARTMGSDANKLTDEAMGAIRDHSDRSSPTCLLATR